MTEEDQKLVALAALHGARFIRIPGDNSDEMFWGTEQYPMKKYTIARAAEHYLFNESLRSRADHYEYQDRTFGLYTYAQDVDEAFVASALA